MLRPRPDVAQRAAGSGTTIRDGLAACVGTDGVTRSDSPVGFTGGLGRPRVTELDGVGTSDRLGLGPVSLDDDGEDVGVLVLVGDGVRLGGAGVVVGVLVGAGVVGCGSGEVGTVVGAVAEDDGTRADVEVPGRPTPPRVGVQLERGDHGVSRVAEAVGVAVAAELPGAVCEEVAVPLPAGALARLVGAPGRGLSPGCGVASEPKTSSRVAWPSWRSTGTWVPDTAAATPPIDSVPRAINAAAPTRTLPRRVPRA
ncbi:hypothetical protein G9U51_12705 [Calidifontibacter sp. DB0510]|uniref:Uncharacterized protein n=1 Tax=Metallococcus carri TaxID=1656884 RepID=A0A967EFI0_9MICO|nr:hypothetical protein [Metallococcus carri]NHN56641.1 hypothetical protein [Metallococcus carri]NOP38940.1 hypothetical protein [Calidifontibacter sp. DB2511S]